MQIENERYIVTFCEKGGEMQSFLDKETGIQYLYQGDSEYWGGKNPALFPIISNTYTGTYEIDGKEYAMKNHGLIRYETLTCIAHSENAITFELKANEETLKQYPFVFTYHVTYTLADNKVTVLYEIVNDGDADMPFTFGLHPGFLCPLTKTETFEDYTLSFSNQEHVRQWIFTGEGPVQYQYEDVKDIPLRYEWFEKHKTIVYDGMKSAYISLQGKEHGVKVSIAGYPILALWTPRKGAPFLCIEPWYGHGDFGEVKEDFYHRDGTMILSSQQQFTTSYTIEVF